MPPKPTPHGCVLAFILFGLLLVSLLWSTRRSLHAILGGSVDELYTRIARLGSGNFSSVIPVAAGMENSVLGWLSETQINLARIDAQRKQAEEEVRKRTKELSDSVLASLNMMEDAVRQRENAELAYAELEQTHEQLVEASRQRGMAEVATNVLHNVGNVLNSVNVSASLVVENVKNSRAASMAKVVALLREHEADLGSFITSDPKGRHIPAFLEQLAEDWLGQQQAVVKELESLRANIDHIKEIVAMQQSHAKVSGSAETVNVRDLVEDSLRMNAGSLIKHQVRVVREFEEVPPISVEKHKVLQILVNLVRNAKQACDELDGREKTHDAAHRAGRRPHQDIGQRQRRRHRAGKPDAHLCPRLHHPQGRPRLRPAQRRARRHRAGRQPERPQRRSRQRRDLHARAGAAAARSPRMNDAAHLAAQLAASRILVIDDNQAIHEDFRKIFGASRERSAPSAAELALFGGGAELAGAPEFQIDSAYQGEEGLALVRLAQEQQQPLCHGLRRRAHAAGLGRHRNHGADLAARPRHPDRDLHRLLGLFLERDAGQARALGPAGDPEEAVRHHRGGAAGQRADREVAAGAAIALDPGRPGTQGRGAHARAGADG